MFSRMFNASLFHTMRVDGDWSRQGLKMAKHTKKPAVINSPYDMCAIANMLQVLESIDYSTQVKFDIFFELDSLSLHSLPLYEK